MPPDDDEEVLEDDYEQPFTPPRRSLDDTHPSTDSNIDQMELYDEGLDGAAEATDPLDDYDPEDDDELKRAM